MDATKIRFVEEDLGQYYCYSVMVGQKRCGELVMSEDGFWNYWLEEDSSGFLPSWFLRSIVDKLDELNKEWEENINVYFGERNDQAN